jgi:hypothetical protein
MPSHKLRGVKKLMGLVLAIAFACACLPFLTWGQLGLPKIPKVVKKAAKKKETKPTEPATPEVAASRAATFEISQVSPGAAPPGGSGQVVVTGKGLTDKIKLEFYCGESRFSLENVKVESPTRATGQIHVPLDAAEGPCQNIMAGPKQPFRISMSADMPILLAATLLGEGDLDFFELMGNMTEKMMKAAQANWQSSAATKPAPKQGLELSGGSVKYYEDGKLSFEEKSGVKSLGQMTQGGQAVGIFRIVFDDGKIYNFGDSSSSGSKDTAYLFLKKKFNK